ncbi:ras guanine nucleotide exchange factor Y-like [Littorina saxatilis]|uniref:RING-type domain-containing protein n=1 Tax=Littorina saxatilis TaxID=31220 RepID=A0AAN9GBL5_9CAEN
MSQAGGSVSWTSMNENLMALLEAVLSLAASDASASRRPTRPAIKAGGHSEEIFLDLTEDEQDEFSCSICYQVLKESMQCLNHHKFCHSCLYVWSTTGQYANRVRCPVCRCQGYYFRNDDLDEKINKKKVKCSMDGCRWTGQLKMLGGHRHTNYGEATATRTPSYTLRDEESNDESDDDDDDESDSTVLELPYLGRAAPELPHRLQSRFTGTGLQARRLMTTTRATAEDSSESPTVRTTTTPLDRSTVTAATIMRHRRNAAAVSAEPPSSPVGGGAGILLRERQNANTLNTNTETAGQGGLALLRERRNANPLNTNAESTGQRDGVLLRERRNANPLNTNAESTGQGDGVLLRERRNANPLNTNAESTGQGDGVLLRERQNANTLNTNPETAGQGGLALLRERRNANYLNTNAETTGQGGGALLRDRRINNSETSNQAGVVLLRDRRNSTSRASIRNSEALGSTTAVEGAGGSSLGERPSSDASVEASSSQTSSTSPTPAPTRLSVRQRVHPIRRGPVNRIAVSHTDSNNNLAATTANNTTTEEATPQATPTPRQPRPPSAPRPANQATRRNLPGLTTAARPPRGQSTGQSTGLRNSSPPPHVIRAPPTFNAATTPRTHTNHVAVNNFHDRLQESRDRLEGLMSNFSGELERSRQEMADFQLERERQRREQLTEVRELGRRLGQVASELRLLLNHRTQLSPSDSDD